MPDPFASTSPSKGYLREGSIIAQDASGSDLVCLGKLPDGDYGMSALDANGNALVVVDQDGMKVKDTSGNVLVVLGKQADGTHGIAVLDVNGQTLFKVTSELGQTAPRAVIPLAQRGGSSLSGTPAQFLRPGTTSATMFELWRGDFWSVGALVDYDLNIYGNGGNVSWQIDCYEVGAAAYTVVGPNVETTNTQRADTFTIPAAALVSGTDPAGRRMTVRVKAQLNSGLATADVAINGPMISHA